MRILYKTMWLCLLAVCLCTLAATPVSAKVCFVGEENCTGGGSFDHYKDPAEDGNLCTQEGYVKRSECTSDPSKRIVEYCPYNSGYVKCCGAEFAYDSCVYPLLVKDRCVNKFKCQCDPEKYPYTAQACRDLNINSRAAGASCAQVEGFNTALGGTTTEIYYTECKCDEALYPYTDEDCANDGGVSNGEMCRGSDGVSRYPYCICDRTKYPYTSSGCDNEENGDFGADDSQGHCIQGGIYYFHACRRCDNYPATSLANVDGGKGVGYEECPNAPTKRWKILKCKYGWKPGANGGNCTPMTCDETVKAWINDPSYPSRKTTYKILNKASMSASSSHSTYVITEEISPTYIYRGKTYYSGGDFGQRVSDSMIQTRCNTRPILNWRYSSFDGSGSSTVFYGVNLKFTGSSASTSSSDTFYCYNCSISGSNVTFNGTTTLAKGSYYNAASDSSMNVNVSGKLTIKGQYTSTGYNYTGGNIIVDNTAERKVLFDLQQPDGTRGMFKPTTMTVLGLAAMKNAEATVANTCIGTTCNGTSNASGVTYISNGHYSSLTLYNTNYYLYEWANNRSNNLHMSSGTMFGGDASGKIIFQSNTRYMVGFARLHRYCDDCPDTAYPYLTSSGSWTTRRWYEGGGRCGPYCAKTSNKGDRPDDIMCMITGTGVKTHRAGGRTHPDCRWFDKGNDVQKEYFQFYNI